MATGQIAETRGVGKEATKAAQHRQETCRQATLWAVAASQPRRPARERPDWLLDDRTKRQGKRGVAKARMALAHQEPEQLDLGLAS